MGRGHDRDAAAGYRPDYDPAVSRLGQALSEGDGISILAEVADPDAAGRAERQGADALVAGSGAVSVREGSQLPLLHLGPPGDADAAGADAVVVPAEVGAWEAARSAELEAVVRVADGEDLERALEDIDPEILLLSAPSGVGDDRLETLLELLHDVPAGKLAIGELRDATAHDVAELERAGMDGVLVSLADVASLVGEDPPDV
jgi:hypothetical protein